MPIKLLTIDFWNTIFDSTGGYERNNYRMKALIDEIDRMGIIIKKDELDKAMNATWEFFNRVWEEEHRTPMPKESVEFYWNFLKLPSNEHAVDNIVHAFAISILEHPPKVLPNAKETLEELSKKYDLAIISDTGFSPGTILLELMKKNGIVDLFKVFSFSDETGVSKPHVKAYQYALEKFGYKPEEACHIGDIERTDIAGAKAMGMKSILFAGDETGLFQQKDNSETKADATALSWTEIPEILEKL
jgi:HAD superfamily hydrolase (TIGR01509 family)